MSIVPRIDPFSYAPNILDTLAEDHALVRLHRVGLVLRVIRSRRRRSHGPRRIQTLCAIAVFHLEHVKHGGRWRGWRLASLVLLCLIASIATCYSSSIYRVLDEDDTYLALQPHPAFPRG